MRSIGWGTPLKTIEDEVENLFESRTDQSLDLDDIKLELAKDYGFATWRQLYVHLLDPDEHENDFLDLACLVYFPRDSRGRRVVARRMLEEDPSLATKDIYHAAAVGDVEQVRQCLDQDPELVNERGGYFDWEPLLYACYSRLNLAGLSTFDVAKLLLDRGADPNAHYMWGGQYRFTALTGAFGEGEMGPVNQPEHEEGMRLARLLLDTGADANDGQGLYNRMFESGHDCLNLLIEYGLNGDDKVNWLEETDGEFSDSDESILTYQLKWAVPHHHIERSKLLVENGADVTHTWGDGKTFYTEAVLAGEFELAEYLVEHGAPKSEIPETELFLARCMDGDTKTAQEMLDKSPDLVKTAETDFADAVGRAAGEGKLEGLRTFQALGFNLGFAQGQTPMHQAVLGGHLPIVKWLVEQGGDRHARDHMHGSTPLQWASALGRRECFDYLSIFELKLYDAILSNNAARIRELIEESRDRLEATLEDERAMEQSFEDDWMTPLAFAATRERIEAVRALLDLGANADVNAPDGTSLGDLCEKNAAHEVVSLLKASSQE